MSNLKGLGSVVSQLREQRTNLVNDLKHVDAALSVLGKLSGGTNHAAPRRTLSASARRKIAAAQRLRWAKVRAKNVTPIKSPKPAKRTMSASARRKIVAVQRARWAKVRGKAKAARPKRTMSASSRRKIATAQRARWAKFRKSAKK
jgi:hypothetical protein